MRSSNLHTSTNHTVHVQLNLHHAILDNDVVVTVLLDGSSVGSCLGTLEILKVLNLELFLGSTEQSETVIGYELRSVREWYQRYIKE